MGCGGWSNLREVDGPCPIWMDGAHHRHIRKVAKDIHRLTGAKSWIDLPRRQLCVGYERGNGSTALVESFPLFRGRQTPEMFDAVTSPVTVSDIVYLIRIARVDPALKEKWGAAWRKKREDALAKAKGDMLREHAAGVLSNLERQYERYTMGRHYRRSVAMS